MWPFIPKKPAEVQRLIELTNSGVLEWHRVAGGGFEARQGPCEATLFKTIKFFVYPGGVYVNGHAYCGSSCALRDAIFVSIDKRRVAEKQSIDASVSKFLGVGNK